MLTNSNCSNDKTETLYEKRNARYEKKMIYLETYSSSQDDTLTRSSDFTMPIYRASNPCSISSYTMPSYLMCDTITFNPYHADSASYSFNQEIKLSESDISYSQVRCYIIV